MVGTAYEAGTGLATPKPELLSGDECRIPVAMPHVALKPSRAVAELLRTKRKERGWSLREIEKKTAEAGELIPFPSLSKLEQGQLEPGVRRLHVLLKIYEVPYQLVSDLVELEGIAGELPKGQEPKALYEEGLRLWKSGDSRKAIAYLIALQKLLKDKPQDRLLRQKAMVSFAIMAGSVGKYYLAFEIIGKLLREPPEPSLLVSVLVQAGVCWHRLGSCEAALAFLDRAERHLPSHAHQERAWVLHEKASTFATFGCFQEAADALRPAITAYRKAGDSYGEGAALAVQARIHLKQGDGQAALTATRQARSHAERHRFTRLKILRRIDEGLAVLMLGNMDQSVSVLRAALAEALTEGDRHAEFHAHHGLWKAYTALGQGDQATFELGAAVHYVRFVDEASEEAREVRAVARNLEQRQGRAAVRRRRASR